MKIVALRKTIMAAACILCAGEAVANEEQNLVKPENKVAVREYSERAAELLEAYSLPSRTPNRMGHPALALRPPPLSEEHLTEEYRLAWEELLWGLVSGSPSDLQVTRMGNRILEALSRMGDPRSVAALEQAFIHTAREGVAHEQVIKRQKDILLVLVVIADDNALSVILSSLDVVDERYEEQNQATTPDGLLLRDKVYQMMLQPENPGTSAAQKKRIENAKKWQALLKKHDGTNLSEKNRAFLDKANSFERETH